MERSLPAWAHPCARLCGAALPAAILPQPLGTEQQQRHTEATPERQTPERAEAAPRGKLYLIAEEELRRERSCGRRGGVEEGEGMGKGEERGGGREKKNKRNIAGINSAITTEPVNCREGETEGRGRRFTLVGCQVEGCSRGEGAAREANLGFFQPQHQPWQRQAGM